MRNSKRTKMAIGASILVIVIVSVLAFVAFIYLENSRSRKVLQWLNDPASNQEFAVHLNQRCNNSVFLIPTDGMIGYIWGDIFRLGHRHQGIDIFGGTNPGETPVIAAYDGFLSRYEDWKASVIIRIPKDPLLPDQQIWLYYTHLADKFGNSFIVEDFPPGTIEEPVKAGTILGYQGDYSGNTYKPVGVHLHFSIVKDDGNGKFMNELDIRNTLDPSPYFNLFLNNNKNKGNIPVCEEK